jgi:hypothetical protein
MVVVVDGAVVEVEVVVDSGDVGTVVVVAGGAGAAGDPVVSATVGEQAATQTQSTTTTARSRFIGPTLSIRGFCRALSSIQSLCYTGCQHAQWLRDHCI